jgi:hypothetical protein
VRERPTLVTAALDLIDTASWSRSPREPRTRACVSHVGDAPAGGGRGGRRCQPTPIPMKWRTRRRTRGARLELTPSCGSAEVVEGRLSQIPLVDAPLFTWMRSTIKRRRTPRPHRARPRTCATATS